MIDSIKLFFIDGWEAGRCSLEFIARNLFGTVIFSLALVLFQITPSYLYYKWKAR